MRLRLLHWTRQQRRGLGAGNALKWLLFMYEMQMRPPFIQPVPFLKELRMVN